MAFDLAGLVQQYLGGRGTTNPEQTAADFNQVAQNAPRETVAQGVTEALRSDQTPPFSQMVGQLFGHGDSQQRAGMLNQLIGGLSPALLSSLGGGALGALFQGKDATATITPEQAQQITPDQVQEIAANAEQQNPGIVDKMGDFYAQHPALVKSIGGAALAIVLGRIAEGIKH